MRQRFEPRARTLLGVCFCGGQHDFIAEVRCSFCNFVIFPTFKIFSAVLRLTLAIPQLRDGADSRIGCSGGPGGSWETTGACALALPPKGGRGDNLGNARRRFPKAISSRNKKPRPDRIPAGLSQR